MENYKTHNLKNYLIENPFYSSFFQFSVFVQSFDRNLQFYINFTINNLLLALYLLAILNHPLDPHVTVLVSQIASNWLVA